MQFIRQTTRTSILALAAATWLALGAAGCQTDPDPAERELFTYLTMCPTSSSQCQSNCRDSSDLSNNGIIEGAEEQVYNVCIGNCQSACYQAFLWYVLNDEGN
ncbi:MAG: hypothetical protein KDK39_14805 [Leptospiraceae bacterium]|nr:hypothetical protein [Leptospiraceae bacterium]